MVCWSAREQRACGVWRSNLIIFVSEPESNWVIVSSCFSFMTLTSGAFGSLPFLLLFHALIFPSIKGTSFGGVREMSGGEKKIVLSGDRDLCITIACIRSFRSTRRRLAIFSTRRFCIFFSSLLWPRLDVERRVTSRDSGRRVQFLMKFSVFKNYLNFRALIVNYHLAFNNASRRTRRNIKKAASYNSLTFCCCSDLDNSDVLHFSSTKRHNSSDMPQTVAGG